MAWNDELDAELGSAAAPAAMPNMAELDAAVGVAPTAQRPTARPAYGAIPAGAMESTLMGLLRGPADFGNSLLNLNDRVVGMIPRYAESQKQRMAERDQYTRNYNRDYGANPISEGLRITGNTATIAPFMAAAPAAQGLFGNALLGAGGAAMLSGGSDKPLANQLMAGAVGGAVLPAAVRVAAGAISPELSEAAYYLLQRGVELTPGQRLGGMFHRFEQGMQSIPGLGDLIKNRTRESFESLHKGVGNEVLAPVGVRIPENVAAGHDSIAYARRELGSRYDDLLARGTLDHSTVMPNLQLVMAQAPQHLPEEQVRTLNSILQHDVVDVINKNPQNAVTGADYKGIDSALRHEAETYGKMEKRSDRDLGEALDQIRGYLRGEFDRQNPGIAGELQPVDSAYARFVRYQRASASQAAGKDEGLFTPEQLNAAVRAEDGSIRKGAYAQGNSLMQPMAMAANQVMGSKVPDSGTPYRALVPMMLAAMGGHQAGVPFAPEAMALLGAGALPYTQPGMRMLNRLITPRESPALQNAGYVLRQIAPYTAPAGGALAEMLAE